MVRPASVDFQPYFDVGETAHLLLAGGDKDVEIVHVEQLAEITIDFGAITSTEITEQTAADLRVEGTQLAQWRFRIDDHAVDVSFNLRSPNQIGKTKNVRTKIKSHLAIPEFAHKYMWMASEFFVWKDEEPAFNLVTNQSGDGLSAQGYLRFSGWRYDFTELNAGNKLGPEDPGYIFGANQLWVNGGSRR